MIRARLTLLILLISTLPISQAQATDVVFPGERPFTLVVPTKYQPGTPAPLIIALHPPHPLHLQNRSHPS